MPVAFCDAVHDRLSFGRYSGPVRVRGKALPHAEIVDSRWPVVVALACLLVACGDNDDEEGSGAGAAIPPAAQAVTISGRVTYDLVPQAAVGGLDYDLTEVRPARVVTVQFVSGTTVLAQGRTDNAGDYSLSVPANRTGFVRALAESVRSGSSSWDFRVLDNVNGDAIYSLDGAARSSGSADSTRDLHAASGWTGSGYGEPRAAAPFAILDTVVVGAEFVLASGALSLPPLAMHWSPDNIATYGANGDPDPVSGEIGTSFYGVDTSPRLNGIYLLGDEDGDTEEYDRHVILHEFGHYLERQLGRSDSIGGPHARGDLLDLRVAFSEGASTAFAGLALGNSIYRDTGGRGQAGAFSFDIEGPRTGPPHFESPNPAPGFYSEQSVWELVYDLGDADIDGNDLFEYPFADIWNVLAGRIVTTTAVTSIFPFLNAFKDGHAGDAPALDRLAADQTIGAVTSDYGDNESNDAGSGDVLPIHTELVVNGATVNVCSTDEFGWISPSGGVNKLASRRFLRFTPPNAGRIAIAVQTTSTPNDVAADPDWIVRRFGPVAISDSAPSAACLDIAVAGWQPGLCTESATVDNVLNAEYVLEVYEWTNTNAADDEEFPPIGRTCFDVRVTQ